MSETKATTLTQGTVLDDKWIIMELIGKGAMGEVYRAHQTNLKRDVAIKTISEAVISEIAEDPDELDIAFGRFQREVQTMAKVRHQNILTIYDYGEVVDDNGDKRRRTAYIAMEYIPGDSLRFTLEEDGLDDVPAEYGEWIKKYFMPILDGVEVLHNNKIIHRDLKPENIFLDGGVPKIGDFGLARSYQMKAVTSSIEMLGTLAYMSPEQCADFKTANFTTDIYALGKILFEAVHGTLTEKTVPFTSVSIAEPQGTFLKEISEIIKKATLEKPEERYQSIQELRSDLQKALQLLEHQDETESAPDSPTILSKLYTTKRIIWLVVGVTIAIVLALSMGFYHLADKNESSIGLDDSSYMDHADIPTGQYVVLQKNVENLARNIIGNDGSQMVLTGDVTSREDNPLFYMDKQKITNFLFVEFLNSVADKLSVKNGVVRHGETIVIYIGSGEAEEDVILYKHDQFHLKDQKDGIKPVVRVTYHGAHLYAVNHEKDLLSEKEWRFGYRFHAKNSKTENPVANQVEKRNFSGMMHDSAVPAEVEKSPKVLDGMGRTIKEWVRVSEPGSSEESVPGNGEVYESGVLDADRAGKGMLPLKRFPWEGFDDVGFRTKIPVLRNQG